MARLNPVDRTLTVKLVYYGPGLCGKTTNLMQLHEAYPDTVRGEMVKLDTDTERTLFFDYFPTDLGQIGRFKLKAGLFTVPGQSFYNATRKAVLAGVDGIVFVADSSPSREEANLVSLQNMRENLEALGKDPDDIPMVFQWNKRDVPRALSVKLLQRMLNPKGLPAVEAVATRNEGVWETHGLILEAVLKRLRERAAEERRRSQDAS